MHTSALLDSKIAWACAPLTRRDHRGMVDVLVVVGHRFCVTPKVLTKNR